jgi:hypothetical protein
MEETNFKISKTFKALVKEHITTTIGNNQQRLEVQMEKLSNSQKTDLQNLKDSLSIAEGKLQVAKRKVEIYESEGMSKSSQVAILELKHLLNVKELELKRLITDTKNTLLKHIIEKWLKGSSAISNLETLSSLIKTGNCERPELKNLLSDIEDIKERIEEYQNTDNTKIYREAVECCEQEVKNLKELIIIISEDYSID